MEYFLVTFERMQNNNRCLFSATFETNSRKELIDWLMKSNVSIIFMMEITKEEYGEEKELTEITRWDGTNQTKFTFNSKSSQLEEI